MGPLWAPGRLQLGAGEQGEFVWLSKALGGTIREAPGVSQEDRGGRGRRREDGLLCQQLSLERKVFLNARSGPADGYHRHAAYSRQAAALSRPPSPSAFFIFRLICFVNVFLPSPSLRADCDSYCKASKGKLKINMKKYCKKDYGECPCARGGRCRGDAGQEHPQGRPATARAGLWAGLGWLWPPLERQRWAAMPCVTWDEHTTDPDPGAVPASAGVSYFPSAFQWFKNILNGFCCGDEQQAVPCHLDPIPP